MSGQRAGTADHSPGSRRYDAPHGTFAPPAQRRPEGGPSDRGFAADGGLTDPRNGRGDGTSGSRSEARATQARRGDEQRRGGAKAAALAVGLPALGAAVDEAIGSGVGLVFALCAVLGTALAALLSSKSGWWWVATAPPAVVLALTAGAEMLVHGDKYQGKALATGAARWAIQAFPVTAAAVGAALLVMVIKVAVEGRGRRG